MPSIAPYIKPYFPDDNGQPLAGGFLHTFETGTNTPKATYKYSSGTAHTNPIELDARGEIPDDAGLYLDSDIPYRFRLERADLTEVWTRDGVTTKIDVSQIAGVAPITVDTVADMKALTGLVDGAKVKPSGYYAAGDYDMRERIFIVDATPPADNGGTVIHNNAGTGYFYLPDKYALDIREFGARGVSYQADAAFINACLNEAKARTNGAVVCLPPGEYGLETNALYDGSKPIILLGAGEATKFRAISGFPGGALFDLGNAITAYGFRSMAKDFMLIGPTVAASNGIRLRKMNTFRCENLKIQNQTTGIELSDSFACEFESCDFDVCYTYGLIATTIAHNTMIERCNFFTCGVLNGGHAINFSVASDNLGIKDNDFEFCNVNVRLNGGTSVEITGNYMEYHDDACFDFAAMCYGVTIESNWIALGGSGGGSSQTIGNVTGGTFKFNRIHDQTVSFNSATLVGFDVGINYKTGTGTLATAPWIAPTLLNSWAQQANYTVVGYIKDSDGWVNLRGALVSGTAPSVAFTLPTGYRPASIAVFGNDSASGPGRITVKTNGDVELTVAASNNGCLDGIRFYVG